MDICAKEISDVQHHQPLFQAEKAPIQWHKGWKISFNICSKNHHGCTFLCETRSLILGFNCFDISSAKEKILYDLRPSIWPLSHWLLETVYKIKSNFLTVPPKKSLALRMEKSLLKMWQLESTIQSLLHLYWKIFCSPKCWKPFGVGTSACTLHISPYDILRNDNICNTTFIPQSMKYKSHSNVVLYSNLFHL